MRLKRNIRLMTWFFFLTDFKLYGPIAIIYFSNVTSSYALGTAIFSIIYITSAIFDVPAGILSDRIGRKKTLVLGASAAVIYTIVYAIGMNFWVLAIAGVFEGLSRALYSGNNQAILHNMLSEAGEEDKYHIYSGKLHSMFQASLALSALVGSLLVGWSFALLIWITVIPKIICVFICMQISDAENKQEVHPNILGHLKESIQLFIHNPKLRLLSVTNAVTFGIVETAYEFQAIFFSMLLPIWGVNLAKSAANAFAFLGYRFSGNLITRFKETNVLLWGNIYGQVANFIALLFPTVASPFLMASTSLIRGTSATASQTLLQKEFTDKQRSTMTSLNSFGGSLFFAIFAFGIGILADQIGPLKTFLVIQFISLPTLWLTWRLHHLSKIR